MRRAPTFLAKGGLLAIPPTLVRLLILLARVPLLAALLAALTGLLILLTRLILLTAALLLTPLAGLLGLLTGVSLTATWLFGVLILVVGIGHEHLL